MKRVASLPHDVALFLGGKLVAGSVVIAAAALVGLLVIAAVFGAGLARLPLALAWCVFSGAALFCFFLLLQFVASTRRGANVVSTIVVFPVMMIGGSFFPFESMPGWMAAIGRWTPNGQAVVHLKRMLRGGLELDTLAVATLAIGIPALVAFVWSARLLRGRFVSEA